MGEAPEASHTFTPRVVGVDHGEAVFAVDYHLSFFRRHLRSPVLTVGASAVGLAEAFEVLQSRALGEALLAEACNQLLEHGGEPVVAAVTLWGLDREEATPLLEGVVAGCREAGCALAPVRYAAGHGPGAAVFAVGVNEQKKVVDARRVRCGDVVLGIVEGGFLPLDISPSSLLFVAGRSPARCYTRALVGVLRRYRRKFPIHAVVAPSPVMWHGGKGARDLRGLLAAKLAPSLTLSFQWETTEETAHRGTEDPQGPRDNGSLCPGDARFGLGLLVVVGSHFAASVRRQLRRHRLNCVPVGTIEQAQ